MKGQSIVKNFFLLSPVILLVGIGIFSKTTRDTVPKYGCQAQSYSGSYSEALHAMFEGNRLNVPVAYQDENTKLAGVLGVAEPDERWIEVDLSEQKIRAWDANRIFLESPVSTGLPWWPTPIGEFRIWIKLRYARMEGGEGNYYYNLPNVPYVMFFENEELPGWRGYGLHGTYWHDDFGTARSHGCVNLPNDVAEKLYYWTTPDITRGKSVVHASPHSPGTRIIIHD